ncbi:MAG TPA: ABC transporter substrate-binding protein [Burkholderiales bacterium]|jgi:ABC-type branched-subunit amino acid transport system substrate-binding protein
MKKYLIALAAFALACGHAWAADLVIAHISPLTGPVAPNGQGLLVGARAYFDQVNAAGGVNGNKIVLTTGDDAYKPAESVRLAKEAAANPNTLALINFVGVANTEAVVKSGLLESAGIPIVGPRAGAQSLRVPVNPLVFHTYASYWDEVNAIIETFGSMGVRRFAVFYQDDPFGKDPLEGVKASLQKHGYELAVAAPYQRGEKGIAEAGAKIMQSNPQAVIFAATAAAAAEFVKQFKGKMPGVQFAGISAIDTATLVRLATAPLAHGFVLAQNSPNPIKSSVPLVREHLASLAKYAPPGTKPNFYTVGGYINARVIVEALKRAGPAPTRAKFIAALESMRDFDVGGGYLISFGPGKRVGTGFVELVIIGADGQPRS